jgi:hypothetical protein
MCKASQRIALIPPSQDEACVDVAKTEARLCQHAHARQCATAVWDRRSERHDLGMHIFAVD